MDCIRSQFRARRLLIAGGVALSCVVAGLWCVGWRAFVVTTPSMGTAAPVGSLVVTQPIAGQDIEVGDVITFYPQGRSVTFTHRVVAINESGYSTRGDINAANDPWVVTPDQVVGHAIGIMPGWGWFVRGLPWVAVLLCGAELVIRRIRVAHWQSFFRIMGVVCASTILVVVMRPLAGFQVLTTTPTGHDIRITAVSTGLLPITLRGTGRAASEPLRTGEIGSLVAPSQGGDGVMLNAELALSAGQWLVVGVIAMMPMLWCLCAGFRVDQPHAES